MLSGDPPKPQLHSIRDIIEKGLCDQEFFVAKPWTTCIEDQFYEDFKVEFSREDIIFNELNCVLLLMSIQNLQSVDRQATRNYAGAISNGPMQFISKLLTQSKKALENV